MVIVTIISLLLSYRRCNSRDWPASFRPGKPALPPAPRLCVLLLLPARSLYPLVPWRPAVSVCPPGLSRDRLGKSRCVRGWRWPALGAASLGREPVNQQMVGRQVRGDQERSPGGEDQLWVSEMLCWEQCVPAPLGGAAPREQCPL